MSDNRPVLSGPRQPADFAVSSSFPPPAPRLNPNRPQWAVDPPFSQSRTGCYISPDISPTTPLHEQQTRGYPLPSLVHRAPADFNRRSSEGAQYWRPPGIFHPRQEDTGAYHEVGQTPMQKHRKGRAPKKAEGKQPTFLTKLYSILEQPDSQHIIRWDEPGEVIIIEKPDELADKILPLVYRQSRFASFSRQLNIYGFMRRVSLRHVDRGICDPDASTWSHPFLRRNSSREEILGFKRRVPPRPSQAEKRRASMPDDSQSPGSISEGSYPHSPPDQYPPHGLANVQEGMPSIFAHGSTRSMSEQYGNGPSFIFRPETIGQKPTLFGSFERDPASLTPQSAPANTKVFPTRVNQGHIRTRSVQVEPPTATLFSPISPLSQPAWMACHHAETILRDAGEPPTYNPADAITWARRGFMNLPNHGNQPSSLPSDFTGGNRFPSPMHLAPSNFSAALSVDSPKTVSPGVYQAGYPMPAYRPAYIPPSPRAVSARPEKRTAVLSASYVPRTRAMLPPVGDLRRHSGERSSETRLDEESALPSASLKGFGNHPFESVLPEDNVETTVGPEEAD